MSNDLERMAGLLFGVKASDGQRVELAEGGTRLALPGGDFLQIGDSSLLFWHRGQWRRGQVIGYDKDRQGAPVANVRLLDAPGLPSENIAVKVGARAMREPLATKAKKAKTTKTLKEVTDDLDGVFAGDMLAHELEELLAASFREAFDTTWRKAQATVNAPKPAPGVTTKQAKGKPKRITTTKGTITFKG